MARITQRNAASPAVVMILVFVLMAAVVLPIWLILNSDGCPELAQAFFPGYCTTSETGAAPADQPG